MPMVGESWNRATNPVSEQDNLLAFKEERGTAETLFEPSLNTD